MRQKGFVPIIFLVLITIAIVGYFGLKYFKPTASPLPIPSSIQTQTPELTNWKTYTSTSQGLSFQIPKQFVVSETKGVIEVFLNQEALDKSKVCKPDPNEVEPLPCSPFLFDVFYADVSKSTYKNGEDYVNQVQGGMGGDPPYQTINGQGLTWTAGPGAGLELRPTVRAFAYEGDKLRYVQINTYVLPFWEYTHNVSSNKSDWNTALAQTDWAKIDSFSYQIISTFKFTQ